MNCHSKGLNSNFKK